MARDSAMDFRSPDYADRQLPNDIEAEFLVLGAVLYNNDAAERCEALRPAHFYEPTHGRMWAAMLGLIAKGQTADATTLGALMESDAGFLDLGGWAWLADLIDKAPTLSVVREYAEIVIDRALRREMILFSSELAQQAKTVDPEQPAAAVLEQAERHLFDIAEEGQGEQGGFVTFGSALDGAVQMAAEAYQRDGGLAGLATGLIDLDAKLGGLHPSDLLILAGRPSMGKTALATNIAYHVARRYVAGPVVDGVKTAAEGGVVAFFSLEMSEEQLAGRILADVAGVSGDKVRKGEISAVEFGRLRDAAAEIRNIPLHIEPTGAISMARLRARARRLKRRHGLDLIVVDYLQLMTVDGRSRNNRVEEVSAITAGLKALAKDLDVPVIALSQLSRKVEERPDKKPQLSDLRDSGSIEQDADAVMFVYREAYYLGRTEPRAGTVDHENWCDEMSKVQGLAEVIIGKQRHGPIGTVRLTFNEDLAKFGNLAREGRFEPSQTTMTYGGARD